MKNKIINALYWTCVAIGAVELSNIGFWLMNQPSTIIFTSGVMLNVIVVVMLAVVIEREIKKFKK